MRIAILGAGNLGISIAQGLIANQFYTAMYLTRRNLQSLRKFEEQPNVKISSNNIEAVRESDILIIAVQPTQMQGLLQEVKSELHERHVIISTVTGVMLSEMEKVVGKNHVLIRSMPNTAIAVGQSMTCLCGNDKAGDHMGVAENIFNKLGHSIIIPESKMQAATVICASGIAYWMRMIRATTQGAVQLGFDAKDAQELAMHTCMGAASLLINSRSHPEEEIDKVTTPRGCTIEGLNEMEHNGLSSSLIKGMQASFKKINNISEM